MREKQLRAAKRNVVTAKTCCKTQMCAVHIDPPTLPRLLRREGVGTAMLQIAGLVGRS
jgi:hypothetical protein